MLQPKLSRMYSMCFSAANLTDSRFVSRHVHMMFKSLLQSSPTNYCTICESLICMQLRGNPLFTVTAVAFASKFSLSDKIRL